MGEMTIEQADDMTDDEFCALIEVRRPAMVLDDAQRDVMVAAHQQWVETLEDDLRDGIDWNTDTHSNWDIYAELRMNGVDFSRQPQMAMGI